MAGFRISPGNKTGKKKIIRGKMPQKRSINLALVGVERIDPKLALAGSLIVFLLAAMFSKFLVADRLAAMYRENDHVAALRTQLAQEYDRAAAFGSIADEYAHYTYSGMTEEELSLVDRADVIRMIKEGTENNREVESWSLRGNVVTLTVSGRDLQEINQLARRLEQFDLVNTCTVTAASKEEIQAQGSSGPEDGSSVVRANIIVFLQSEETDKEEGAS